MGSPRKTDPVDRLFKLVKRDPVQDEKQSQQMLDDAKTLIEEIKDTQQRFTQAVQKDPKDDINLNVTDENGLTFLTFASGKGHATIVNLLLEHNANPNHGFIPLAPAIHQGATAIVELLLKYNANPNQSDDRFNKMPMLTLAVLHSDEEMVELLLKYKANPNQKIENEHKATPLLTAVSNEVQPSIVELLLKYNANPNQPCGVENSVTPLLTAICVDRMAKVELLLKYGANPNQSCGVENSETPLLTAICIDRTAIVELLLKYGANPNEVRKNAIPLMTASHHGLVAMVKLLLNAGADVDMISPTTNKTALDYAIEGKQFDVIVLLLERGAVIRNPIEFKKFLGSHKDQHSLQIAYCYGVLCDQEAKSLRAQAFGHYANASKNGFSPAFSRLAELTDQIEKEKINKREIRISTIGLFKSKNIIETARCLIGGYLEDLEMGEKVSRIMFNAS